jgi:hypothetical protein
MGDEQLDYPAEMGQGMGLVQDLLFDFIQDVIVAFTIALPELEIIGHSGLRFFAPVAGKRLRVIFEINQIVWWGCLIFKILIFNCRSLQ